MAKRNNLNLKAELEEKNKEFDHSDAFLGKDVLTMANKINSSRNIMFQSHIDQCVVLAEPEYPRVFTNYENEVGKYSSSYVKAEKDYEVVKKISKYENQPDYNYLLIVKDKENNYDVIQRTIGEKLTEDYCYMYHNEVIDSKSKGDSIKEGEVLYRSTSFDPDMNYCYGVNANTVYLIENNTIEDAICISDEFAKKLESYYLSEIEINVNTNDILCNLYGNDDDYKVLPDIGEETMPQILTSRRRINYDNALYDLQADNLRNINHNTDTIFYTNGIVTDIDIYCNQDLDELKKYFYNKQIVRYLEMQNKYNKEIVSTVERILRDKNNTVSNDLKFIYRRAKDSLDPKIKWIEKTDFDNLIIIVRVMRRNPIHIGSKIVGRYGNKGVISKILPKDEMPVNQYGEHADLIMNALGIVNRLNPAQLYEVELNFVADNILRKIKEMKTSKEKLNYLFDFMKTVNPTQAKAMYEYFKSLDKKGKKKFIEDTEEKGIYIHMPPFWDNITFDQLSRIYEKYDWIEPYKCTVKGKPVEHDLIFGSEYILRLKHEASNKFSARSSAYINMKGSPSKSMTYKKNQDLYSSTPIRLGEMEFDNLLLTQNNEVVKLASMYSASEENRQYMIEQLLTEDVLDMEEIELMNEQDNHNRKILDVYLKSLGIRLED